MSAYILSYPSHHIKNIPGLPSLRAKLSAYLGGGIAMTGFCVFGISKSLCKKLADKKQETFEYVDGQGALAGKPVRRSFSIQEWAIKRDELAALMFAESVRRVQISPNFDAPQFARDWIESARFEVRDCIIMARGEKVDKHGGPIIKGGVPVMTWIEYDPSKAMEFGPLKFDGDVFAAVQP